MSSHGSSWSFRIIIKTFPKIISRHVTSKVQLVHPQHDESSPLHLACAQGSLDMVRTLLEVDPDELFGMLFLTDSMGMTPIHTAALFDHAEIAEYLAELVYPVVIHESHPGIVYSKGN